VDKQTFSGKKVIAKNFIDFKACLEIGETPKIRALRRPRRRRRQFVGAAADAMLVCLIILLHFSSFALFRYKWLPQELEIYRQQFMLLQNLTLKIDF